MEPSGGINTSSITAPPNLSMHLPEDPGTSAHHIRFFTPSSSPRTNSPELSHTFNTMKRMRTRSEMPSALAILAAVCSSPSVRWDGVKHRYGEGSGKSIWCPDLRVANEQSHHTHIVRPSSPTPPLVYGERPFTLRGTMKEDMESHGIDDVQKTSVTPEVRCSMVEDGCDGASKIPVDQDYFSEFPSTPPTLVYSSPYEVSTYDFSSSDRSSILPLLSPCLTFQNKTASAKSTASTHGAHILDVADNTTSAPQEFLSAEVTLHAPGAGPDLPPSDCVVMHRESNHREAEGLVKDCESARGPSLAPSCAPLLLPRLGLNLSLSPLSSPMSSPLSELLDEEASSPTASRLSLMSDGVSARSTSPDMDVDIDYSKRITGRRASVNFIITKSRRMNGLSGSKYRRRSGTAPPETTPSKDLRQPLTASIIPCPLPAPHSYFSGSTSSPGGPTIPMESHEETVRATKKQKHQTQTAKAFTSFKVKPLTEPSRSSDSGVSHQSLKRRKGRASKQPPHKHADVDGTVPVLSRLSSTELTALPVTGFLVETLALSRASAITAPELLRAVLKSQPRLMEERSEASWMDLVRLILQNVRMFGRIERRGKDAADWPLEDQWFYIPENDDEAGRAELLRGLMPKKRSVTKRSKQYYFEPVQKVSRWDPEED